MKKVLRVQLVLCTCTRTCTRTSCLSSQQMYGHYLGEDVFSSLNFGPESPPLTALIASILRRYPDGGQIMKVRKFVIFLTSRDYHLQLRRS